MRMRHGLASGILLAGLLSSAGTAADEPLPKGEEILDKFVDATGGKAAYLKVHNEEWKGTFEFLGKGIKGAATSYRAEPNRSLTTINLDGVGTIVEGTDGDLAWTNSSLQGPRLKLGDEKAVSMREATFQGPLLWRKMYKQAETVGVETVDGQPSYKVVMTPNEGKPETRYFDKKTNLLVKIVMTLASPMGEIPAETAVSDYKEQNGLTTPRKLRQKALGQEFLITIDSVTYDVDLPKDRFDLPAEVKALVAKTDSTAK